MTHSWPAAQWLRLGLKLLAVLIAGILVGQLLLVAVYSIPESALARHMDDALREIRRDAQIERVDELNRASMMDTYTDSIMLSEGFSARQSSAWARAVSTTYLRIPALKAYDSFLEIYGNGSEDYQEIHYVRYWHGYLALLKPLMVCFGYSRIRWLNTALQAALLALLTCAMLRRGLRRAVIPMLIAVLCLAPRAIVKTLQYSNVTIVTLLAMLALMTRRGRRHERFVFALCGMAVSYVDLLTYPMLALTSTLTLSLLLDVRDGIDSRGAFGRLLLRAVCWGFGYVGMWAGKWALAIMLYGKPAWEYILGGIVERSGDAVSSARVNRVAGMLKCVLQLLSNYQGSFAGLCFVIYTLGRRPIARLRAALHAPAAGPLIIIMAIPLVWLVIMGNHTVLHGWMVYRNLGALAWGVLLLISGALKPDQATGR